MEMRSNYSLIDLINGSLIRKEVAEEVWIGKIGIFLNSDQVSIAKF